MGLSSRGPAFSEQSRTTAKGVRVSVSLVDSPRRKGKGRGRKAPWEGCDECGIHQICGLKGLWSDLLQTSI